MPERSRPKRAAVADVRVDSSRLKAGRAAAWYNTDVVQMKNTGVETTQPTQQWKLPCPDKIARRVN